MNTKAFFALISIMIILGYGKLYGANNLVPAQKSSANQQTSVPVETENNNTYQSANSLEINGSIAGTLNIDGDYYDYFKVALSSDGSIAFAVVPNANQDAYLDLYDMNGYSFLRASRQTGVGITDSLVFENLKAGTYFIRVGGGGSGSYLLSNTFTPTAFPFGNDSEPNDKQSESLLMNINTSTTGHFGFMGEGTIDFYDWYSVTIPYDGKITMKIIPEKTLDNYLDFYDINGESFITSSIQMGTGISDSIIYPNLKAGTYFLRVGGGGYGSYTLSTNFIPTAIPTVTELETNDTGEQANSFSFNSKSTGHLNFFGNGTTDYYDFYSFTTTKKGSLIFNLIPESTLDSYFDLYSSDGNSFSGNSSNSGTGQSDTLVYDEMQAGTYYLRIGGAGYGSYTLTGMFHEPLNSLNKKEIDQPLFYTDHKNKILIIENISVSTQLEVIDSNGRVIIKEQLNNESTTIDFNGYKGIFLIKVRSTKGTQTTKLIF